MSFDALAWAAKQNPGSSGAKLVLLGLAECASRPEGLAYPSTAALVEFSCLDRKSVVANLDRLERLGLITDTGRRAGRTMQIKVYQLNMESLPKTEASQKRNSSENGRERLPKTVLGISNGISTSRAKALSVSVEVALMTGDILPGDAAAWAEANMGWHLTQAHAEWERFVDHAKAKGRWQKDWAAAWRNWCRSPYCKTKSAEDATAYRQEPMRV
jgi:pyocin large subunit-like protein